MQDDDLNRKRAIFCVFLLGGSLNDFIKYYEPAFYDSDRIAFEHRRLRRAAAAAQQDKSGDDDGYPLKLTISTKNRYVNSLVFSSYGLVIF